MNINDLNPWWKTKKIPEDMGKLPPRALFQEMVPYANERQIVVLTGLRRTGKTTLLHHLIASLLESHPAEHILYYNFDLMEDLPLEELIFSPLKALGIDPREQKIFVFLDEIQKRKGWENEVKLLYDFRNIKFFLSGSSSLFIEKKSKESLAGRTYSFTLEPLSFKEYLNCKNLSFDLKKSFLFSEELQQALHHYLLTGGFPELAEVQDTTKINKYVKELIVDRVIHIDIPLAFQIEEPELLQRLLTLVSAHPGMVTDYENLASDLGRNRKTITAYLFYLEKAFLLRKVYNYSKNRLTSERKAKRLYPSSTALAFLYNAEFGRIIETAVLQKGKFLFFSREGNKEVDFISGSDREVFPLEVKYSEKIRPEEFKWLRLFMQKYSLKKGQIITKEKEEVIETEEGKITLIPLWKWLLQGDNL